MKNQNTFFKKIVFIISLGLTQIMSAQVAGDYGSAATGNWGTVANWLVFVSNADWSDATAAPGAPSATTNVWIRAGHTVNMEASSKVCKNLNVVATGAITTAAAGSSLTINGDAKIDGSLGTDAAGPVVQFGVSGTISGSGTFYFSKLRPNANGIKITVDMNINGYTATGNFINCNSKTPFTLELKAGRTITLPTGGYISTQSNSSTSDPGTGANVIWDIYGTINAPVTSGGGISLANLAGFSSTLNIYNGGVVNTGRLSSLAAGAAVPESIRVNINNGGILTLTGVITNDATKAIVTVNGTLDYGNSTGRTFGTTIVNSSGTIALKDSLLPSGILTLNSGAKVKYYGTTKFVLPKVLSTYPNLEINNSEGVTVSVPITVTGNLNLANGKAALSSNNIIAGSVSGGSSSAYIVTDSTGVLKINSVGGSSIKFPVGTALSYNPITISNTGTADNFSVHLQSVVEHSPLDTSKIVRRQWTVGEDVAGGSNAAIQFQWNVAEEATTFNRATNVVLGKYDGSSWSEISSSTTGSDPYIVSISGVTSCGNFAVGNKNAFSVSIAKTVTSNGTGGGEWTSSSSWQGGVVPDTIDAVTIAAGDSIYFSTPVKCNNLTVMTNGKLSTGTSSNNVTVSGTFTLQANGWYYNNSSSVSFPGSTRNIDNSSNYVHIGSGSVGAIGNSTFGNLILMRGTNGTTAGAPLIVNGNLVMNNTGNGATFRGASASTGSLTHLVQGNVFINGGQLSAIDVGTDTTVAIWNFNGNVTVTSANSRFGAFTSASAKGLAIININGHLNVSNGARFQVGSSSTLGSGTGIVNLKGNFILASDAATSALNMNGPFAINFVGTDTQYVTLGRAMTLGSDLAPNFSWNDTVKVGAKVVFNGGSRWGQTSGTAGSFVIKGNVIFTAGDTVTGVQKFVMTGGASLGTTHPKGLEGSIQTSGEKNIDYGCNFLFNGTQPQISGTMMPGKVNRLSVKNAAGVTLSNSTMVTLFEFLNGKFTLSTCALMVDSITGANETRYVVTENDWQLSILKNNLLKYFPVGTSSEYLPVWITPGGVDTFSVTVKTNATPAPFGGRVKAEWTISPWTSSGTNFTAKFGWNPSAEDAAFAANRAGNAFIFNLKDTTQAGTGIYTTQFATAPYSISRSGILPFSSFTSGRFAVGKFMNVLSVENAENIPAEYKLYQNYPNPFNPSTTIKFTVANESIAKVKIFNALGQEVALLFNGTAEPGKVYSVQFNAAELSSGMYFSVFENDTQHLVKKIMLLK